MFGPVSTSSCGPSGESSLSLATNASPPCAAQQRLDHGMPPRADREPIARVHLRTHPAVLTRHLGQRLEGVEIGDRLGRGADRGRLLERRLPQRLEERALERRGALVRADHVLLDLAQLRRA